MNTGQGQSETEREEPLALTRLHEHRPAPRGGGMTEWSGDRGGRCFSFYLCFSPCNSILIGNKLNEINFPSAGDANW